MDHRLPGHVPDEPWRREAHQGYLPAFRREIRAAGCELVAHPSEATIVGESLKSRRERLLHELESTAPDTIVTLGNAALRVMRHLVAVDDAPLRLSDLPGQYGRALVAQLATGRRVTWLPLAYPAAPPSYQAVHDRWMDQQESRRSPRHDVGD